MTVRIIDGTEHRDVSPDMLEMLQQKDLVYRCGGCKYWHLSDNKSWKDIEEAVRLTLN